MSVIITGGSGFVGKNLWQYLLSLEISVLPVSLRGDDWKSKINFDADAIIHLAGKAHDTSNTSDASSYFKVNRDLTILLFNHFLTSPIRDFFFFSSVKAAADTVDDVLEEGMPCNPQTPYGRSKFEAEEYLLKQKLPAGKRLFIVRPCMIHGPGNKGNLNLLYKIVQKGIPWPLGAFHNHRSFLSIDNLSFLISSILDNKEVESGIYNFADDEPISTNELVSLISETLGKQSKIIHLPIRFVQMLAKIGNILPFPIDSERLKKLTESYVVSNEKIKQALAIDKLPISTRNGLLTTLQSFKQNI
ncbi:UDP-glucose 4-epimerase [Sphingobacterium deserti]|uniref:UDP-glucose 4-epimerase n=2 Tax=Sphingobacterium deserti TaxID=1229276 RepID=A0A0B8T7A4_9SPHI|nr:UDP-glucose 4-epimerase [Sphingobacterium deserti]